MKISAVIPAWCEATAMVAVVSACLREVEEVVVADAGSPDDTAEVARAAGARVVALACAMRSIVSGLIVGAATFWAFRHADPWTPRFTGTLIGAAAGCVAAAGIGLSCGSVHLGHLLVGHGLVVPLLAGVGALTARRVLAP